MEVRRPHVWVEMPQGTPSWPGLVMHWRQTPDGDWEAWVAMMSRSFAHGPFDRIGFRWVPASELRPLT